MRSIEKSVEAESPVDDVVGKDEGAAEGLVGDVRKDESAVQLEVEE